MKKFLAFLFLIASLIWFDRRMPAKDSALIAESSMGLIPYVQASMLAVAGAPDDGLDMVFVSGGYMLAQNPLPFSEETVPDVPAILERIIWCESGWNPKAKNPRSTASGLAQFLDSTWRSTMRKMGLPEDSDVFDYDLNLKAAMFLFNEQGTAPWNASRNCWEESL